MTRKFIAHLGFLLFVNLLVKPFWIFGIDRVVQNQVGAAEYGNYFSLYNFSVLLYVLLDFGISNFNNRQVARDEKSLVENLGSLFLLKLILSAVYLSVTLGAAFLIGYSGQNLIWLLVLCLGQVFLSFLLFFRSGMSGLHAFKEDAILSISDRSLMILLVGSLLLLFAGQFQIQYFIYAQTIAWGLSALIAFFWLMKKADSIYWDWDTKSILPLLRQTAPFAFLALLMSIYSRIDGVMIERILKENGNEEAGIYAASFRLLDAVNMFAYLFASLLLPMFAKMIAHKKSVVSLAGLSARILGGAAIVLIIGALVYGQPLMKFLYPAANEYYARVFVLLMSSFSGVALVYVFGSLMTAAHHMKILNWISFGGVFLNIALNFFLIPKKGALGAATATLITQGLVGAAHVIAAWQLFPFPFRWQYFLQISVFTFLLCLVAYGLEMTAIQWGFKAVIWILVSIPVVFISKFMPPPAELMQRWQSEEKIV